MYGLSILRPICRLAMQGKRTGLFLSIHPRYLSSSPVYKKTGEYTIIAHQPSLTNYKDIVSRAPHLCVKEILSSSTEAGQKKNEISLTILTTPSFATWLEDDDFMIQLLDSLSLDKVKGGSIDVEVVSAVVDRLPLPRSQQVGSAGKEGFAVMCGPKDLLSPNTAECGPALTGASIVFSLPKYKEKKKNRGKKIIKPLPRSIVVPLAKTIFNNGKDSTLITSTWQKQSHEPTDSIKHPWTKFQQSERVSKRIHLTPEEVAFSEHIPVVALTEPCKVISSMGNIVRQIAQNDKARTVIPASQELEASVSSTFKRLKIAPQAVGVWAAIFQFNTKKRTNIPPRLVSKDFKDYKILRLKGPLGPPSIHRVRMLTQAAKDIYKNFTDLINLVSGGGGWGLKEGLVSLDPQSELEFLPQPPTDDIQSLSSVGKIIKPRSYIQYFLPKNVLPVKTDESLEKQQELTDDNSSPETQKAWPQTASLILGTTTSSMDYIPDPITAADGLTKEAEKHKDFDVYLSHFGALSEHGIFYVAQNLDFSTRRSTKLDVPFSWLCFDRDYTPRDQSQVHE